MILSLAFGLTTYFSKPDLTAYYQEVARVKSQRIQKVSPTPSQTPIPTPTPKPSQGYSEISITSETVKNYMMAEINSYRKNQGKGEVQTDKYTCEFAKVRASEVAKNFNHDGFQNRIKNKTLPYPSYSYVTENIAMNSNYKNVVKGWINSAGHAENMRADTPNVCVEKFGNFYAYEGWKS